MLNEERIATSRQLVGDFAARIGKSIAFGEHSLATELLHIG